MRTTKPHGAIREFCLRAFRVPYTALMLGLLIAICKIGGTEPITIEIGLLSTGGEPGAGSWPPMAGGAEAYGAGDWIRGEIKSFMESHPDIKVVEFAIEKPRRVDVPLSSVQELPHNIIGIDSWWGYEAALLAERELIVPIDDFLPDPDFSLDLFYPNLLNSVTYDGKVWGVPWVADPMFLAYNLRLFEKAGLPGPPETWDEYFDYSTKLTQDVDGDGQTDQWGSLRVNQDVLFQLFHTWVLQKGGTLFTSEGAKLAPAQSVGEAIQLLKPGPGVPTSLLDPTGSQIENVGMIVLDANLLNMLRGSRNFALAPLPTFGKKVTISYGRLYLAVRKSTPEQQRASWELIKWISRRDVAMPRFWGGYPCRSDFILRDDFKERMGTGIRNLDVLYRSTAWSLDPAPHLMGRDAAWQALYPQMVPVFTGSKTIEEVIPDTERALNLHLRPFDPKDKSLELFR